MAELGIVEIIQQVIEKLGALWSAEDKQKVMAIVTSIFTKGQTPRKSIGFDKDQIEAMYDTGLKQYEAGKYQEASKTFNYLYFLDPKEYRFAFGNAASLHKEKKYDKAVPFYLEAYQLDRENPYPWFHAGDCYQHMNQGEAAIIAFGHAIHLCGDKPEYQKVKEMATSLRNFTKEYYARYAKTAPNAAKAPE